MQLLGIFLHFLFVLILSNIWCRNAIKLIVSISALTKGQIIIVKTSLIGSMFLNLFFALGMCFFFGGINWMEQHFNIIVANTAASLLALSVGSLIISTAFYFTLLSKFNDSFRLIINTNLCSHEP